MQKRIPAHVSGLLAYLSRPHERANEDQALAYFRQVFGTAFTRQREARGSDGYVQGSFVLELKGRTNDWLSGLFQGLAYKNKGLDFGQIVVAAKDFLAVWRVEDLPEEIRNEVLDAEGAPNRIGVEFAKAYASQRKSLLRLAAWNGNEVAGTLFQQSELFAEAIASFERMLKDGKKVRLKVTLQNFPSILKEMKQFFDPKQPVKAVRAFYSMLYGWKEAATIELSYRVDHQATLQGESITDLVPSKRRQFKEYVENRFVSLRSTENRDDFFARYDEALDAVDKSFRIKNGIFFTDRSLSKFVLWLVKKHIPNLGKNYLVIDPACGSGNLVTNWRSPLELRHKVVSEIEPELLFAVEKRMKGDQWHSGKYTVVPKTSANRGLNFLDRSAEDYLEELRTHLDEAGHKPDKPLAFLCNPPYRSDDDQKADRIGYTVHPSITELTGRDASSERYCCFLAQMKLICDAARSNGLPDESRLLLFTGSAWLTNRKIYSSIREHMLSSFENLAGILVNGSEFFDVGGKWPVAFTVWSYNSRHRTLDGNRDIPLKDLTWLKKEQLAQIPWDDPVEMEKACQKLLTHVDARTVALGQSSMSLKTWSRETRKDFMRGKRKLEKNQRFVGGLPIGDRRHGNKKAYGESNGSFIGFMDDLTPCRIRASQVNMPWLRLNNQFMDLNKNRCFSGPPTHFGYCAHDLGSAQRLFFWYALTRTLATHGYPMWTNADDLWAPTIPRAIERRVFQSAFAIAFAENDCVEATFPANNPSRGTPEVYLNNPMSPLDRSSFWNTVMRPYCADSCTVGVEGLLDAVDRAFSRWRRLVGSEQPTLSNRAYLLDERPLSVRGGLLQISDYATESDNQSLREDLTGVREALKALKAEFFELISSKAGLDYFGPKRVALSAPVDVPRKRPQRVPAVEQTATRSKPPARVGRPKPVRVLQTA